MFDHERGISGEIPEHIEWIYGTAIPKLRDMGIHVDVVRAERDYRYFFVNAVGGALCRANLRLPDWRQMFHQSRLQVAPIRRYLAEIAGGPRYVKNRIVQYIRHRRR